jgi:hypothetical protein
MRPNSRQLALRDPAISALVGIIGSGGSDFGRESSFGADFGADFDGEFGADVDVGADFGLDIHGDLGAEAVRPTAKQAVAAFHHHRNKMMASKRREAVLYPNKGSDVQVERYAFSTAAAITMGTPLALNMTNNPDTTIRPQVVTMNAPSPMFVFVQEISVANVKVTIGGGQVEDAYNYSALAVGKTLDMPTVTPAQRAQVIANYTGFVPPAFVGGVFPSQLYFTATFKGPASVVA